MGRDIRDESLVAEARDRIAEFGAWLDHARRAVPIPDWDRELEATQATLDGEAKRVSGDVDPAVWGEIADRWIALGRPYVTAYSHWREAETAPVSRRSSEGDQIAAGGAGDRGRIGRGAAARSSRGT